ncbi:diacylglycerol kinase [Paenibacillus arenilitoris]|uniref:Diacylglycerol kinase n=1 Tax=Paenibacillus arenilitoris TaxID=2772299 RepID=A0A927CN88_9BACL|nr:diacylglycerol kinase [Paenibacillus arenilitoris]MBD2868946.1 diacylglycerol kinase [Paenibacillus arenilitoris]
MAIKRARLIYNPTSGREEMKRRLPDILQRLEKGGIETSCHMTIGEGDATLAASEAADRGYDMVIAAGGDGTLYEVINGLTGKADRPPLGILPVGTTNDFARAMGIPKHWEYAVDLIIQQYSRPIDVGKANERYFINIAGGGSLTELTYDVPSKLKTMIGQLAYYMKGMEKMTRLRPTELHFQAAEVGEFHDEFMMFLICNSNSVGGFERLAPDSKLDDGLLDVLLIRKCNLPEFIKLVTLALRGEHLNDPHVIHFRTNELKVTTPDYVQINLDGEYGGVLPCSFSVLPSHLHIFADETGSSTYR